MIKHKGDIRVPKPPVRSPAQELPTSADPSAYLPNCRQGRFQKPAAGTRRSPVSNKPRDGLNGVRSAKRFVIGQGNLMTNLTDTILVIGCPHCIVGMEFRAMIAYKDGRFVCRDCAHTVRPGVPRYKCVCRPCMTLAIEAAEDWTPLHLRKFSTEFS
jgi:hypothetical protein